MNALRRDHLCIRRARLGDEAEALTRADWRALTPDQRPNQRGEPS